MSTVRAFIRNPRNTGATVCVRFRLSDGRDVQLFHKSDIKVDPLTWDHKKEQYKTKVPISPQQKASFNKSIIERKTLLLEVYDEVRYERLNSKLFEKHIEKRLYPEKYKLSFFEIFDIFLQKHRLSEVRKRNYQVVKRALMRYELYIQKSTENPFSLEIDKITADTLKDIEMFFENECHIYREYPEIYLVVAESRPPKPRGRNTINLMFGRIKTFFLWSIVHEYTNNNPFNKFNVGECIYGTPYYISVEERNMIAETDLSDYPKLAASRDIFIFQCLIGCRVGDLWEMTQKNIINGAVEYIARKTREGRPVTIRVPLNSKAKEVLARYKENGSSKLFPFPTQQMYNYDIKDIFRISGITRIVTILNPTTGEAEQRPINELASSHLARRTFIGNLYKRVKDPNLVSSLSGHKDGSKAFARYRDIDEEMKTELVKMLE